MDVMLIISAVVAFLITVLIGKPIIEWLRKLKCGQTIYEEGPSWHKSKNGTPTMGGIMFIAAVILTSAAVFGFYAATYVFSGFPGLPVLTGLIAMLLFSLIGFIDDFVKVVKKRNLGLTAWQKLIFQFIIAGVFVYFMKLCGVVDADAVRMPFFGYLNIGWIYYPLAVCVIVFVVNAVNLTDGIDGLAATVTTACGIGYFVVAGIMGDRLPEWVSAAFVGGCSGFLVFNAHPAKVFMGDTGSMFLGGFVALMPFVLGYPGGVFLSGGLYILEALSVCLQVLSFKTTGKRIFLMSPIHHHFEKKGWSEVKIVYVFTAVEILFVAAFIAGYIL